MKRILMWAMVLVTLIALCGCNGTDGSSGGAGKNATITASQLKTALKNAGYEVTDQEVSSADLNVGNVKSVSMFSLFREKDDIEEGGVAGFFVMEDEASAKEVYELLLLDFEDEPFSKSSSADGEKAIASSKIGDRSDYGNTVIISRVKNTVVILNIDWDNYQDAGVRYDGKAEQVIKDLGY